MSAWNATLRATLHGLFLTVVCGFAPLWLTSQMLALVTGDPATMA